MFLAHLLCFLQENTEYCNSIVECSDFFAFLFVSPEQLKVLSWLNTLQVIKNFLVVQEGGCYLQNIDFKEHLFVYLKTRLTYM